MDYEPVAFPLLRIVDKTIGTLKSIRMIGARVLDVSAHHFTAVLCHATLSHNHSTSAIGSLADGQLSLSQIAKQTEL